MATDSLGWLDALEGLPEQLTAAHEAAGAIAAADLPSFDGVRNIVVAGMGGSGIAGDVLNAVASGALPVPVSVLKQYRLPGFVNEDTLFFAMSYSGGTEETLSMTETALDRGARVVAVTRGGDLGDLAASRGALHVMCPEVPLPRAAIGGLVAPLFVLPFRGGLLPEGHGLLMQAQAQLAERREKCRPSVEGTANPARELARKIGRTIPIIYGGGAIGAVAAYRWKCDINENAKAPAFWHTYPELDHNEICGWGLHGDVTRQVFTLVELRHGNEHARVSPRFEATREIIEETVVDVLEVQAAGEGRLAQLLDLVYLGDWVSSYLAFDQDVDPGPIDAIFQLKARLADTSR